MFLFSEFRTSGNVFFWFKSYAKNVLSSTHKRETHVERKEEEANRLQMKILKIWVDSNLSLAPYWREEKVLSCLQKETVT